MSCRRAGTWVLAAASSCLLSGACTTRLQITHTEQKSRAAGCQPGWSVPWVFQVQCPSNGATMHHMQCVFATVMEWPS